MIGALEHLDRLARRPPEHPILMKDIAELDERVLREEHRLVVNARMRDLLADRILSLMRRLGVVFRQPALDQIRDQIGPSAFLAVSVFTGASFAASGFCAAGAAGRVGGRGASTRNVSGSSAARWKSGAGWRPSCRNSALMGTMTITASPKNIIRRTGVFRPEPKSLASRPLGVGSIASKSSKECEFLGNFLHRFGFCRPSQNWLWRDERWFRS